ncbi:MAG: TlpA family protein disulfide reductase [Chitinophagaceae bacterium]|nr:MAG: TlpA family protein disulfide reductase [Chitinophagaceae bacterium]
MNLVYKIAFISIICITSCKGKENSKVEPVTSNRVESELNKIKLTGLDNSTIDLKQYKGKTLFLNFWATWCKPCLEEMPSIQKAQTILGNKNIVFLFASEETPEQIEKFKTGHDYNFNYLRVENLEELNIIGLPTTFIFNQEGKLVFSEMGYHQWDDKNNIDLILNATK